MRKTQMLLNPFISLQADVFAGVYLPARRSGCEARSHRGNHAKPTSVELNLHPLTDLSLTSTTLGTAAPFTIPIAATSVRLRGLVQHVLSPPWRRPEYFGLDCLQALGIKRYTLGGTSDAPAHRDMAQLRYIARGAYVLSEDKPEKNALLDDGWMHRYSSWDEYSRDPNFSARDDGRFHLALSLFHSAAISLRRPFSYCS